MVCKDNIVHESNIICCIKNILWAFVYKLVCRALLNFMPSVGCYPFNKIRPNRFFDNSFHVYHIRSLFFMLIDLHLTTFVVSHRVLYIYCRKYNSQTVKFQMTDISFYTLKPIKPFWPLIIYSDLDCSNLYYGHTEKRFSKIIMFKTNIIFRLFVWLKYYIVDLAMHYYC